VLVRDSTTITLNAALAEDFPGSRNQPQHKTAIMRIQSVFDLVSEAFCSFAMTAYTRNDQAAAEDILPLLQAEDCLIQDLGFFSLPVPQAERKIAAKGAYFLSRLKYGVCLYNPETHTPFALLNTLRKQGHLDIELCAGVQERLPVRLVAIPLPEAVAAARRRKAKANRDRRRHLSKEYLALLSWEIFITNIPSELLTAEFRLRNRSVRPALAH
jgi:hypothetical protein